MQYLFFIEIVVSSFLDLQHTKRIVLPQVDTNQDQSIEIPQTKASFPLSESYRENFQAQMCISSVHTLLSY